MEFTKTLYKKDTSGKIRELTICTEGADLLQISGVVGGALTEHRKTCVAKNVGRANETSPIDQAWAEAESKVADKLTTGYFLSEQEAKQSKVILPMLAKSYVKEAKKIDWTKPVYAQPKLDGMRSLYIEGELISRKGKLIDTISHIQTELGDSDILLDGELYAHHLNFQENMRLIKKYRAGESELIKYNVYDIVSKEPFIKRWMQLQAISKGKQYLTVVETVTLKNEADLHIYHAKNLRRGYEGTMVRWGDEGYKINGRSSNLLKFKDFQDIALPIKDVEPADQRPTWGVPVFHWEGAKDDELRAGVKGMSHAEREEFLVNKDQYIGQMAELRFFEYSDKGVPRFPIMHGIRLDK